MRYSAVVALMVVALAGGLMAQTQVKKEAATKVPGSTEAVKATGGSAASTHQTATDVKKTHHGVEATAKAHAEKETGEVAGTGTKAGEEHATSTHTKTWSRHKHTARTKESVVKEKSAEKAQEPAK